VRKGRKVANVQFLLPVLLKFYTRTWGDKILNYNAQQCKWTVSKILNWEDRHPHVTLFDAAVRPQATLLLAASISLKKQSVDTSISRYFPGAGPSSSILAFYFHSSTCFWEPTCLWWCWWSLALLPWPAEWRPETAHQGVKVFSQFHQCFFLSLPTRRIGGHKECLDDIMNGQWQV